MQSLTTKRMARAGAKLCNLLLILLILAGSFPASIAQASSPEGVPSPASAHDSTACQAATPASSHGLFLPFLAVGDTLQRVMRAGMETPAAAQAQRELRYAVGKTYVYAWDLTVDSKSLAHDSTGTHERGQETMVVRANAEVTVQERSTDGVFTGQVVLREPFIPGFAAAHSPQPTNKTCGTELIGPIFNHSYIGDSAVV